MLNILKKRIKLIAPVIGESILMEEVNDDVFSQKIMGDGLAIIPQFNEIVSPLDGEVIMVAHTKHAICLRNLSGVEIMIHCGLDTVHLMGKGFDVHVKEGDTVKQGDLLLKFDKTYLNNSKIDLTTPIIVMNKDDFTIIKYNVKKRIQYSDTLMELERKKR